MENPQRLENCKASFELPSTSGFCNQCLDNHVTLYKKNLKDTIYVQFFVKK